MCVACYKWQCHCSLRKAGLRRVMSDCCATVVMTGGCGATVEITCCMYTIESSKLIAHRQPCAKGYHLLKQSFPRETPLQTPASIHSTCTTVMHLAMCLSCLCCHCHDLATSVLMFAGSARGSSDRSYTCSGCAYEAGHRCGLFPISNRCC